MVQIVVHLSLTWDSQEDTPGLKKGHFFWGICALRKFHPSSHRIRLHGIICLSLPEWITAAPGIQWQMRKQCTGCSWYTPLLPTSWGVKKPGTHQARVPDLPLNFSVTLCKLICTFLQKKPLNPNKQKQTKRKNPTDSYLLKLCMN